MNVKEGREMEKLTLQDLHKKDWKTAVIVYKASNWKNYEYSLDSRSYEIHKEGCKYFSDRILCSNSLYGNCLDKKESGIRLDWYNWEVEYCYIVE